LAKETAAKEVDLAASEKQRSELEVTLSISRMNISKMKEKLAKAQLEAEAQTKSTTLIEASLLKEKENCSKLQRELVEMNGKQSSLFVKLNDSKESAASLAKEAQIAAAQIRDLETKLAACESELQLARREAADSIKAKQAYKDAISYTQNTKKELRHLGMELLREQAALEEQAAQHNAQGLVRSRRAESKNNSPETSSVVEAELSSKVSVLQRRLTAEKEAAAKLAAALGQKENEVTKLKKSLEIRMEGDDLQQTLAYLRGQLHLKGKEQRAARAEVAALRAELAAREKEGRTRDQVV
jgi:chromosome segregation ATPase